METPPKWMQVDINLISRTLSKGREHFTVIGQVHTHQDRSGDAPPSTYLIDSYGDLGYSKNNNSLPVFTISYDGKIYGIRGYTDKNGRVSGKFVNMNSYDAQGKSFKWKNNFVKYHQKIT